MSLIEKHHLSLFLLFLFSHSVSDVSSILGIPPKTSSTEGEIFFIPYCLSEDLKRHLTSHAASSIH